MAQILDHIGISVVSYSASKAFYQQALAPLGIEFMMEYGTAGGFGRDGKPAFWIAEAQPSEDGSHERRVSAVHVCFGAADREAVDAFYRAALAAGARDNGAPGLREHYHPNYYGAFVLDPDGHNVEAVFHGAGPA